MRSMSSMMRRAASFVLAMALLASSELGVFSSVFAAQTKKGELYTLLAEEYFSEDADAAGILTSGALNGNAAVSIVYPEAGDKLVSYNEGTLYAKGYASGYKNLKWWPVSYTCGTASGNFSDNAASFSGGEGVTEITVNYELVLTNLDEDLLQLPAELMNEAADHMYVLDKLVSSDEPYMNYMEKLTRGKMNALVSALGPEDEFEIGALNVDPAKDAAVRASFAETVAAIRDNCYNEDKELKIYRLLVNYAESGLAYFYENNEAFQTELDLFTSYMERLLGEETRDGVTLTEEDKIHAAEVLKKMAVSMLGTGAQIEFLELRDKTIGVRDRLDDPNEIINLKSENLGKLVEILEKGTAVTSYAEQPTLRTSVTVELCIHVYDDDADQTCNLCNTKRGSGVITPGTYAGSTGGYSGGAEEDEEVDFENLKFGEGDTARVYTAEEFGNYLAVAESGATIQVVRNLALSGQLKTSGAVTIQNAKFVQGTDYVIRLESTSAGILADGEMRVVSGVDGYQTVKAADSFHYALAEISAPDIGGEVAGDKVEKLENTRYLFLDIDPNGMKLSELKESLVFEDLKDYSVALGIEGNDGSGLVKTADRLVATATNGEGMVVATVTYVVIVLGDTNCNGKVNTSDAAATKAISMGGEYSLEARLAADVNFSGSVAEPKVNSSDVSYVMAKWFAWDLDQYVSNVG